MKNPEIILQHGQSDCGVACLLSIIKYYGGHDSLENLRKLSGTNITGTTLLGLYQAARSLGFDADGCSADITSLIAHKQPCILHVVTENHSEHYMVWLGAGSLYKNKKDQGLRFVLGDPAKGLVHLSEGELEEIWRSKTCLVLTPNEKFRKAADIDESKRKWLIELVRQDFPLLSIAAGLGIAIAVLGLTMAIFSQRLIDDVLPGKKLLSLNLGISILFVLLIVKEGFSFLRQYFLLHQSKDFNIRIIDYFYNHLLKLPKPFFDTRKIGEFTARLNDTARIQRVISQLAGNVLIDALVTLVTLGFLMAYSWKIAVGSLMLLPVYFFLIYKHNKSIIAAQRNVMSSYASTEGNYISTLQGIEPIKNGNKQAIFSSTNKLIYEKFQNSLFSLGKIQIRLSLLANSFGVVFLTGVLLFASYQVLGNHLKTGELIAVLGMCNSLLPSVASLALISIPINEAKIAFGRMFEFTSVEPECNREGKTGTTPEFESLTVDHLSFRFRGRSQILKNIAFTVCKGEIIALMGENGSGKSTLSQILQKNYLPEEGNILVNSGTPLNEISFFDWRNCMGVVPQNIHIFNGTVLENITLENTPGNQEKVLDFLKEYGFLDYIGALPQSVMTLVGEEGINLSGGQKQMIAIARALYRKPGFLILDEATAAMDIESERFVLNMLKELKKNMAIIFITHRLHVLKHFCDRIYILNNRTISAHGDHEDLLKGNNLYSRYWAVLGAGS